MGDDAGKTEKPTPKKLKDAQKDGNFPRTQDAPTWMAVAGAMAALPLAARSTTAEFRELMAQVRDVGVDADVGIALRVAADIPFAVLRGALPMCLGAMLAALVGAAMQGVHPSGKALKPKFDRMNPINGVKRMFGPKAAWEALKALGKVAVIGAVVVFLGMDLIPDLVRGATPLNVTVERGRTGLQATVWAAVLAGILIAFADYAYQRHSVMKKLMMTPKEIRDEFKQSEGDPQVKAAIRQKQHAMSRNRMMANVAGADVVLVNPTHVAIALKYQIGAGAPRVVAKGSEATAAKIRELAKEARVPVVEDKPLARALYQVCEVEEEIPSELYTAVARILAFVMAAGKPSARDGARRAPAGEKLPQLPTKGQLRSRRMSEIRGAREAGAR